MSVISSTKYHSAEADKRLLWNRKIPAMAIFHSRVGDVYSDCWLVYWNISGHEIQWENTRIRFTCSGREVIATCRLHNQTVKKAQIQHLLPPSVWNEPLLTSSVTLSRSDSMSLRVSIQSPLSTDCVTSAMPQLLINSLACSLPSLQLSDGSHWAAISLTGFPARPGDSLWCFDVKYSSLVSPLELSGLAVLLPAGRQI